MRPSARAVALAFATLTVAGAASAHKPSDSYLSLEPVGTEVRGRWDIALRDLDDTLGLDMDGDGVVTWGEVRSRYSDVLAYALPRFELRAGDARCKPEAGTPRIAEHADGRYLALDIAWRCERASPDIALEYDLFFERDASHRGIVRLRGRHAEQTFVLTAHERKKRAGVAASSRASELFGLVELGVRHIWTGYDHMLFLLALLLPAVLRREDGRWVPVGSFRPTLREIVRTVTAFTLAHSATLALAALGWVALPSRLIESAIALSVVLAAANNLWPVVRADRWVAAFELGLLHGFGFATALADAGVQGKSLATTLFGFNCGVELGQLAIVGALLPLAFALRERRLYARWVLGGGSLAVAAIASVWLVERAFALRIIS
jgi:hypothetical protein